MLAEGAGLALVVVAILGGGLKVAGLDFPVINDVRIQLALGAVGLILLGVEGNLPVWALVAIGAVLVLLPIADTSWKVAAVLAVPAGAAVFVAGIALGWDAPSETTEPGAGDAMQETTTSEAPSDTTVAPPPTEPPDDPAPAPDLVAIPRVVNSPRDEAFEEIEAAELVPVEVEAREPSPRVCRGRVLATEPRPGSPVPRGSEVSAVLSGGSCFAELLAALDTALSSTRPEAETLAVDKIIATVDAGLAADPAYKTTTTQSNRLGAVANNAGTSHRQLRDLAPLPKSVQPLRDALIEGSLDGPGWWEQARASFESAAQPDLDAWMGNGSSTHLHRSANAIATAILEEADELMVAEHRRARRSAVVAYLEASQRLEIRFTQVCAMSGAAELAACSEALTVDELVAAMRSYVEERAVVLVALSGELEAGWLAVLATEPQEDALAAARQESLATGDWDALVADAVAIARVAAALVEVDPASTDLAAETRLAAVRAYNVAVAFVAGAPAGDFAEAGRLFREVAGRLAGGATA